MNHSVRAYLLMVILVLFASSCATVPSQTIDLSKSRLVELKTGLLRVSSRDLTVAHSAGLMGPPYLIIGALFPLAYPLLLAVDAAVISSANESQTRDVRRDLHRERFERALASSFLEQVTQLPYFTVYYSDSRQPSADQPDRGSHGALLDLLLEEISLLRRDEKAFLYVRVKGKMLDVRQQRILWERTEVTLSDEGYPLETYKTTQGQQALLDAADGILRKIGARLANDFVYAR